MSKALAPTKEGDRKRQEKNKWVEKRHRHLRHGEREGEFAEVRGGGVVFSPSRTVDRVEKESVRSKGWDPANRGCRCKEGFFSRPCARGSPRGGRRVGRRWNSRRGRIGVKGGKISVSGSLRGALQLRRAGTNAEVSFAYSPNPYSLSTKAAGEAEGAGEAGRGGINPHPDLGAK